MQRQTTGKVIVEIKTRTPLVGKSKAMEGVKEMIDLFGPSDISILITGENGTGKELVARALHGKSARPKGTFIPVNCPAIPEGLFESEILGHVRGAFTGAIRDKKGVFESAQDGTVFLDEVGDLPLLGQAKLLRVLQEREVKRVGDERPIRVDCRVIAATNKDLKEAVEKGSFREDLYYRLCGLLIQVPPLRERKEDIPLLVEFFIQNRARRSSADSISSKGISREALDVLLQWPFPGNIRELEGYINQALVWARGGEIKPEHLPEHLFEESMRRSRLSAGRVKTAELRAAIEAISMAEKKGEALRWIRTIRTVTADGISSFLTGTNGIEFTRKDFEKFLSHATWNGKNSSRYATAGRYLKIMAQEGIVERNGGKANQTRFRIAGGFLKEA